MFHNATFFACLTKIQKERKLTLLNIIKSIGKSVRNILENIFRRTEQLLALREKTTTKKIEMRSGLNKRNIVDVLRLWKEVGFSAGAIGKLKNQKIIPMAGKKEIQKNTAFINVPLEQLG